MSVRMKIFFWGTIVMGIIMPISVMIAIEIILSHADLLSALRFGISHLSGHYILLWLLHDIPFIFLAFLVKSLLSDKVKLSKPYMLRLSEAIGAWVVTVGISFWMNLDVWSSIALLSSGFSTAMLAYYFYPFYGILTILIGFGIGWIIGKIIEKVKKR